ncbi:MAG: glutathione S-transferase family protein [Burkholderiales bacterium]
MITLYELHWSHYCEKIRIALDYMQLEWRMVGIDAFSKKQMREFAAPEHLGGYRVPAIHDDATNIFVMDSTPILRYLADAYPENPQLFPGDAANRALIDAKVLELDTLPGIPGGRFGYSQVILECPDLLADLFLPREAKGFYCLPVIRNITCMIMGMVLSKRLYFHRSESLGLYEALENYLIRMAKELDGREFVVGNQFPAADTTLATHLRTITVVPFFAEHPGLQNLFARHRAVIAKYGKEPQSAYQIAIANARLSRAPMRRKLRDLAAKLPFQTNLQVAGNDQKTVWDWKMAFMPFHCLIGLRQNKLRQVTASLSVR